MDSADPALQICLDDLRLVLVRALGEALGFAGLPLPEGSVMQSSPDGSTQENDWRISAKLPLRLDAGALARLWRRKGNRGRI